MDAEKEQKKAQIEVQKRQQQHLDEMEQLRARQNAFAQVQRAERLLKDNPELAAILSQPVAPAAADEATSPESSEPSTSKKGK